MTKRKRILGAAGGAVGLAGTAAFLGVCCVAPWAVWLFGVSGAVLIARLAFVQPYLLLAALAVLAVAFWWAYRRQPPGDPSCDATTSRRVRRWVWVAAVLMAVLMAISLVPMYFQLV